MTEYNYADVRELVKDVHKARSGLRGSDGELIEFTRIDQLELMDGTSLFACTECMEGTDYTFVQDKVGAVRSHLGWHHNPGRKQRMANRTKGDRNDLNSALVRLRNLVDDIINLAADETKSTHKVRADAAERRLTKVQKSLAKLGLTLEKSQADESEPEDN